MTKHSIFVSIVTWNSEAHIETCLQALLNSKNCELKVQVIDNASTDGTAARVTKFHNVKFQANLQNFGFCAGHNQAVSEFLKSDCEFFLVLNPDVKVAEDTISQMASALTAHAIAGACTPKLIRSDDSLTPIIPTTIDAAGMYITPALRHFDRGSGVPDTGQFDNPAYVFGGTGACLLIRRECVKDVLIDRLWDEDLTEVYPQLCLGIKERAQLFDEGFFAYREDAELAWRMNRLGWNTLYWPQSVAAHHRKVTPERRGSLPAEINKHGVRNRFLLQYSHYEIRNGIRPFIEGVVIRNLVVMAGTILFERSSLEAFRELPKLWRRSMALRALIKQKAKKASDTSYWFKFPARNLEAS